MRQRSDVQHNIDNNEHRQQYCAIMIQCDRGDKYGYNGNCITIYKCIKLTCGTP